MEHREPFKLRKALFLWNFGLAVFSLMGALRFLDEFVYVYKNFGFHFTVCDCTMQLESPTMGFWIWAFNKSKLVEFGDTLFIVLRKQKLIFLHWYHHASVCVFTWFVVSNIFAPARW